MNLKIKELFHFFTKGGGLFPSIMFTLATTISSFLTIAIVVVAVLLGGIYLVLDISGESKVIAIGIIVFIASLILTAINSYAYSGAMASYVDVLKGEKVTLKSYFKKSGELFKPVMIASIIQLILSFVLIALVGFPAWEMLTAGGWTTFFAILLLIVVAFISIVIGILLVPTVFISTIDNKPIRATIRLYKDYLGSIIVMCLILVVIFFLPIQPFNTIFILCIAPAYILMLYFDQNNIQ